MGDEVNLRFLRVFKDRKLEKSMTHMFSFHSTRTLVTLPRNLVLRTVLDFFALGFCSVPVGIYQFPVSLSSVHFTSR